MNRRGFITSALKATAAGILAPEHLWGKSMVAGFRPKMFMGFDPAGGPEETIIAMLVDEQLTKVSLKYAEAFFQASKFGYSIFPLVQEKGTRFEVIT